LGTRLRDSHWRDEANHQQRGENEDQTPATPQGMSPWARHANAIEMTCLIAHNPDQRTIAALQPRLARFMLDAPRIPAPVGKKDNP
jgi:hypothetical protein